jgi:hypothetical protein
VTWQSDKFVSAETETDYQHMRVVAMFFHCLTLWPDLEVISNLLLQTLLTIIILVLLYIKNILSCVHGGHVSLKNS